MGKQKIVMKVPMEDAKKRSRALKVAVGLAGVISAQADGESIVVVGDGIDSVKLVVMLRKKMGSAQLVTVSAADEKKEEKKKEEETIKSIQETIWHYQAPITQQPYVYATRDPYYDPQCCIM